MRSPFMCRLFALACVHVLRMGAVRCHWRPTALGTGTVAPATACMRSACECQPWLCAFTGAEMCISSRVPGLILCGSVSVLGWMLLAHSF